jgi:hypothetical protein
MRIALMTKYLPSGAVLYPEKESEPDVGEPRVIDRRIVEPQFETRHG